MRRLRTRIVLTALAVGLALTGSCRREDKIKLEEPDESTPTLASTVHAADPKTALQLIKGFHPVEQSSWRWTMGTFAVTLHPPTGAAERGATLTSKFSLPEALFQKIKATTLTATIQQTSIGSNTYHQPGEYTFRADVPPEFLKGEAVTIQFALDQFLPAGAVDGRELGAVFLFAGLEAK